MKKKGIVCEVQYGEPDSVFPFRLVEDFTTCRHLIYKLKPSHGVILKSLMFWADKFTVLSFLEALEDSVAKTSESEESRQDDKDLRSQSCNRNDTMDESR